MWHLEDFLPKFSGNLANNTMPEDEVYLRRAYAAYRAAIAVDRAILATKSGASDVETRSAFRWMRLWIACAASYHHHSPASPQQRRQLG